MTEIRIPKITALSAEGQLAQLKSYLYQLTEQLNFALKSVEKQTETLVKESAASAGTKTGGKDSLAAFNSVKALIIKSADIVDAYYEEINKRLEGSYVAQSEFGTYKEEASVQIKEMSDGITQLFKNNQAIVDSVATLETEIIGVKACIKTGLLYYGSDGAPVYGLEIGQRTEIDGEEVFNKYARFTSDRLSFFEQDGVEVAYFSDNKLYVMHVHVKGSFRRGGFVDYIDQSTGEIITKWVWTGGED